MNGHGFEGNAIYNNTVLNTGFANLELNPISQDTYITEYRPDLHYIIFNEVVPKIKIVLNGVELPGSLMNMTQTASFQKIIHAAHVRSLTSNPLEFTLCKGDANEGGNKTFEEVKAEWTWRNNDWHLAQAINTCKQLGNCGLLFSFDKELGQYNITTYSYEDGYQIVPNYDEYGIEIARSLVYQIDKSVVIDTYDASNHYHIVQSDSEGGWTITTEKHGFSRCPL